MGYRQSWFLKFSFVVSLKYMLRIAFISFLYAETQRQTPKDRWKWKSVKYIFFNAFWLQKNAILLRE